MKFSDVKEKHIYNVVFDPVEQNEFNGKHLALVLKKNNDKKTVIVMPLTTSNNGDMINKKDIGILSCLSLSLQKRGNSFAVFNQIRTINVNRMMALKDDSGRIESKIEEKLFLELLGMGIKDMTFCLSADEKIEFFYNLSKEASVKKITSLLYELLKLRKNKEQNQDKIIELENQIKKSILFKDYEFKEKDIFLQSVLKEFLD